jgi:hypothetical protein
MKGQSHSELFGMSWTRKPIPLEICSASPVVESVKGVRIAYSYREIKKSQVWRALSLRPCGSITKALRVKTYEVNCTKLHKDGAHCRDGVNTAMKVQTVITHLKASHKAPIFNQRCLKRDMPPFSFRVMYSYVRTVSVKLFYAMLLFHGLIGSVSVKLF